MARSAPDKLAFNHGTGLANANSPPSTKLLNAGLYPVDTTGLVNIALYGKIGLFYLNPTTWEESKAANWVQNAVPGQSDPILQWISSGPRMVNFEALVTKDTSDFIKVSSSSNTSTTQTFTGNIAAQFFGGFNNSVPTPAITTNNSISSAANLSIVDKLNYYRSFLYPIYTDPNSNSFTLQQSPPLLTLWAGNTFSTIPNPINGKVSANNDLWVLTNLNIKITKQLTNLTPLEALVNFQLVQYTILPFSSSNYQKFDFQSVSDN